MRDEVIVAVRSLSDPQHQATRWGEYDPDVPFYDDFSMTVHTLYDDTEVLPDPQSAVGKVLFPEEIQSFQRLEHVLGPLIDDLGDRPDADYMADPRWNSVIEAAKDVLVAMEAAEQ